jgi:hypothetical protein
VARSDRRDPTNEAAPSTLSAPSAPTPWPDPDIKELS